MKKWIAIILGLVLIAVPVIAFACTPTLTITATGPCENVKITGAYNPDGAGGRHSISMWVDGVWIGAPEWNGNFTGTVEYTVTAPGTHHVKVQSYDRPGGATNWVLRDEKEKDVEVASCYVPTVALNLTFMQPCQPAEGTPALAEWRITNPNSFPVPYTVDKAGTGQILSGTAPAGQSFFTTPWGAQTLILKWAGGQNTKAGGDSYNGTMCYAPTVDWVLIGDCGGVYIALLLDGQQVAEYSAPWNGVEDVSVMFAGYEQYGQSPAVDNPNLNPDTCTIPKPEYDVDCTGVYVLVEPVRTNALLSVRPDPVKEYAYLWSDPLKLESVTIGDVIYSEPAECLEVPACVEQQMYWQVTFTKEGQPDCYLVTWQRGEDGKFINPNAQRQLCLCGWVADNAPYGGWVTKNSCTGEYTYHGTSWGFFQERLLTPNWRGTCAMGGGDDCAAR
jgi:hypothetical protein